MGKSDWLDDRDLDHLQKILIGLCNVDKSRNDVIQVFQRLRAAEKKVERYRKAELAKAPPPSPTRSEE